MVDRSRQAGAYQATLNHDFEVLRSFLGDEGAERALGVEYHLQDSAAGRPDGRHSCFNRSERNGGKIGAKFSARGCS